jgi:prepilin-type N-terminal cleavage/methylation domain-containing protein
MNKTSPTLAQGFTLIEMTVVLLLITLLASVAIRETNSLSFQVRYEQTQERLERIREAILGNPRQIINGQQAISGFVADMGRLPENLRELLQSGSCSDPTKKTPLTCTAPATWTWTSIITYEGKCSDTTFSTKTACQTNGHGWLNVGWNGPYLQVSGNPGDADVLTDGWGTNYNWQMTGADLVIESWGKDGLDEPNNSCGNYDEDCQKVITENTYKKSIVTLSVSIVIPEAFSGICTDSAGTLLPSLTTYSACKNDNATNKWPHKSQTLCMRIFSRKDGDMISESESSNHPVITQDGSHRVVDFEFDSDIATADIQATSFPIGINAIGIYEHDGACTSTLYISDRQNPIQVDFHPRIDLPVINW